MKKWHILVTIMAIAVLTLVACEPEVIEKEVIVTQVVEKEVKVTEIVEVAGTPQVIEKEVVVTQVVEVEVPAEAEDVQEGPKVGGAGDVYRMAVLSDMTTLNIWSAYGPVNSSFWNYAVYGNFYPSVYGITNHRWDYVPNLATDYASPLEEEGDFWVSTVQLRDDVVWSDGTPLTANDWAFTSDVVLALDLQGNWADYNGDYLDHIEVVDDYTAKIYYHTKPGLAVHQYGTLLNIIVNQAFWEPLVAPLLEQAADLADLDPESDEYIVGLQEVVQQLETLDPAGEPICGPFTFVQWEEGAFAEIAKFEDYFNLMTAVTEYVTGGYQEVQGDREFVMGDTSGDVQAEYTEGPWFDSVIFSIYNADAALLALEAGEVDFILTPNGLSRGQIDLLAGNPNVSTAQNPANGFRYMAFNFRRPELTDVTLRQAIACMIDKDFLTQNLLQGAAIPVNTIVPAGNGYWFNPDVPLFCDGMTAEERLTEATRMLSEAGYTWDVEPSWNVDRGGSAEWGVGLKTPDGAYFPEMELLAPSAGYDPLRATAGVYIEQWMNQLGMPVTANLTNFNNILTIKNDPAGEWDMFILGWGVGVIPDYACYFLQPGSGWNSGVYDSEVFDQQCNDFFAETDMETARQIAFEFQETLATDLPYIYLFTTPMWDAWDNTRVMFPFTDVNDGIGSGTYGLKSYVQAVQ